MRTKRLITEADPLGPAVPGELSPRAEAELAALVPAVRPVRRRRTAWAAGLATAVLQAGGGAIIWSQAAPPPPSGNQAVYRSTDKLEDRAQSIVRATVRGTRPETGNGTPETVTTVEVGRVAKGAAGPGERIDIVHTTPGPDAAEAPAEFVAGQEYVFLIRDPDDAGLAPLVSTFQGWYAVRDGRAVPDVRNEVGLSPSTLTALGLPWITSPVRQPTSGR